MGETVRVPVAVGPVRAAVQVPGSKSVTNRALVCAALADGTSVVRGTAPGDDTSAMCECLRALGIGVHHTGRDVVELAGTAGRFADDVTVLPARLAGTTSRFVTALAALGRRPIVIDGDPPLRRRPMGPLHDALRILGATVTALDGEGRLPVEVTGPPTSGRVAIRGDVSSQYVTALMLVGPYLPDGLDLTLTSPLVSRPYVDLTAAVMAAFGVTDVVVTDDRVRVGAGRYVATTFDVEPDASSASYPLAVAAVAGGEVRVEGLGASSQQGDAAFADLLGRMGCHVERGPDVTVVRRDTGRALVGIDVDMADVSDLVPTVAVVAVTASTPTRIRGVGFIRAKESDRLGDLASELGRLGAAVTVEDDGVLITPAPLHGARVATHHDHRLAMAFGVLGTVVAGVEVEDAPVVSKSWPDFWQALHSIVASAARTAGGPA